VTTPDDARTHILNRIHTAHTTNPPPTTDTDTAAAAITRTYHPTHQTTTTPQHLIDLLARNLTDYRAHVHHTTDPTHIPDLVHHLLKGPNLLTPPGLPPEWIPHHPDIHHHTDQPPLTPTQLETIDTVLTTTATAIAETGTLILDTGPGQGRRALTLIPDHHIAVITPRHITDSLPHAIPHLNPTRPLTWIAGPSATSDIELNRIEGVHGPRHLDIIILHDAS
jgi:L-lactate dehydrogenase complex protein LldG